MDGEAQRNPWRLGARPRGPLVNNGGTCAVLAAVFVAGSSAGSRRPPRNQVGNALSDCTVDLSTVVVLLVVTLFGCYAASARIVVLE